MNAAAGMQTMNRFTAGLLHAEGLPKRTLGSTLMRLSGLINRTILCLLPSDKAARTLADPVPSPSDDGFEPESYCPRSVAEPALSQAGRSPSCRLRLPRRI